jgi:hypothetical protein
VPALGEIAGHEVAGARRGDERAIAHRSADLGQRGFGQRNVVIAGGGDGALDHDRALEGNALVEREVDVGSEFLPSGLAPIRHDGRIAQVLRREGARIGLVEADAHRDLGLGQRTEVGGLVEAVEGGPDQRRRDPELILGALHSLGAGDGIKGGELADDQLIVELLDHVVEHDLLLGGEGIGHYGILISEWFKTSSA